LPEAFEGQGYSGVILARQVLCFGEVDRCQTVFDEGRGIAPTIGQAFNSQRGIVNRHCIELGGQADQTVVASDFGAQRAGQSCDASRGIEEEPCTDAYGPIALRRPE